MPYRLLEEFRNRFAGNLYRHRSSTAGDFVAMHLYEDLYKLGKSSKFLEHVDSRDWVVNPANKSWGVVARRGDGTFGELIPGQPVEGRLDYAVARGPTATVEIGVEVKILHKSMIKQIDRVMNDLEHQVQEFQRGGGTPISVAVVGVNHAPFTTGYEGERAYKTTGRGKEGRHPIQEAADAIQRLRANVENKYDFFLILPYVAINEPPFPFEWVDYGITERDYSSILVRLSNLYQQRF